uniref:mas-related G-protein coupled receptor member A1-like n=1 Tax=Pristiophorus japonicus TaxID=55135 RepID=UPI00398EE17E
MTLPFCSVQSALNASQGNGSWTDGPSYRRHFHIISALLLLTVVVGTPLNGLALWVLGCKLKRKNRFVVYVLNLLTSDFLFLFFQGVHTLCILARVNSANQALLAFRSLIVACNAASAFLLTWISVERFFSVAFPVWWRMCRTKQSAVVASWAIWGLSLSLGVLYWGVRGLEGARRQGAVPTRDALIILEFSLAFLAPFLVFCLSNAFILCRPEHPSRKSTKLFRAITLNAVIFLLCWVPYHAFVFLHYRALLAGRPALCTLGFYVAYYSVCLLHVKSCVIPLVYIFISSELKIKFRESLPSIFERRYSEEAGLSSRGPEPEPSARGGGRKSSLIATGSQDVG